MTSGATCSRETACGKPAAIWSVMSLTSCLNSSLAGGFGLAGADFHQHADFGAGVDVGGDEAVAGNFQARVAGDLDVLAHLADGGFAVGFEIDVRDRRHLSWRSHRQNARKASLRATKSVSQFTSTSTPDLPPGAMYWAMTPSRASRVAFLAALAAPDLRRKSTAASRLPLASHERFFAFHHANARHFAELGDICSSNFSHRNIIVRLS
jgi:hypothetical protein